MQEVINFLSDTGKSVLPRILTQICRDSSDSLYGCCDRNWWHYKIRDFPSVILQQAGYAIFLAGELNNACGTNEYKTLASETCMFWNKRALAHGAFEEYYPYEQGYPPVAFSTLSVAKLCAEGIISINDVNAGFEIAISQIMNHFELEAANQQVAGTAALAVIRSIAPEMIDENSFQTLLTRTLDLQTKEGWFPEYDGPDLGYLSVTMDCLWDIYDATDDQRCREAIDSAFDYLSWFVLGYIGVAGMHNARNTDYIVPYGLARLVCEGTSLVASRAIDVMSKLYNRKLNATHFFDAVDDRYWSHYIGHSVFRSLHILITKDHPIAGKKTANTQLDRLSMPESGHVVLAGSLSTSPNILISTKKGAIFTAVWPSAEKVSDFGWIVKSRKQLYVSHWWSLGWKVSEENGDICCTGSMVSHKEHISKPWKHILLRLGSFFMGRRLIRILKRLIIFKGSQSPITFSRKIKCDGCVVIVEDLISGIQHNDMLIRAPRASKRHVASGDSYHPEDFTLITGLNMNEVFHEQESEVYITTKYEINSDLL